MSEQDREPRDLTVDAKCDTCAGSGFYFLSLGGEWGFEATRPLCTCVRMEGPACPECDVIAGGGHKPGCSRWREW